MSFDPKVIDKVLELIPPERRSEFQRKANIYIGQGHLGLCRFIKAVKAELIHMSSKIGDFRNSYVERPHEKKEEIKSCRKKWN